jgi:hypothetical protein
VAFIISDPYARPLFRAFAVQVALLLCCGASRETFRACCFSCVGFWGTAIVILVRRPRSPTKGDLDFISWWLLPIAVFGTLAANVYWHLIGVWDQTHPRNLPPLS